MKITLQLLENIVKGVKSELNEGINDSHSMAMYRGVCLGLDWLLFHVKQEQIEENKNAN